MSTLAIRAGRLFTPLEECADAVVIVEDGRVVAAGRRDAFRLPPGAVEFDALAFTLAPGFVDLHLHGAGGRDLMETDPEALSRVAETVARHGTTAFLATTVTAAPDATCRSLEALSRAASLSPARPASPATAAELLGVHLEGPFISSLRRGVHPTEWIAVPSPDLLERLLVAAGGAARILTLAPELDQALELVRRARAAGLVVALGHTDATYEEAIRAIELGASHAVHVFNAMRPFLHRDVGVLGAVLTRSEVTAEVIADGVHVADPALRLLLAAKGTERIILVSDGTAATGLPDGPFRLGPLELTVVGGVCRDAQGRLAGSTLTLDRAVRRMARLGVPPSEALAMATLNPARRLGLESRKGVVASGADADLVFLDDEFAPRGVMTRHMPQPVLFEQPRSPAA